eukprot:scaffold27823_cov129-Isochrysis_galbana.AAC.8
MPNFCLSANGAASAPFRPYSPVLGHTCWRGACTWVAVRRLQLATAAARQLAACTPRRLLMALQSAW